MGIRHRPERTSKSLVASFFAIPRANTWPSPSPLLGSQVQQSRKVYQRRQTGNASTPHQLASFEHRHLHVPDVLDSNVAYVSSWLDCLTRSITLPVSPRIPPYSDNTQVALRLDPWTPLHDKVERTRTYRQHHAFCGAPSEPCILASPYAYVPLFLLLLFDPTRPKAKQALLLSINYFFYETAYLET